MSDRTVEQHLQAEVDWLRSEHIGYSTTIKYLEAEIQGFQATIASLREALERYKGTGCQCSPCINTKKALAGTEP